MNGTPSTGCRQAGLNQTAYERGDKLSDLQQCSIDAGSTGRERTHPSYEGLIMGYGTVRS